MSFPLRRSPKQTHRLSLSLDGSFALVNLTDVCSAAAVAQVSFLRHQNQAPPQLLILNIAQHVILTSDPVDVKMSGYGLFAFCRAAVKSARAERVSLLSEAMGCQY